MTRRPHIAGPAHAQLRERAERAVAASTSQPPAGADSDQLRRWHELQVSQIELDLQNEALARLQNERDLASAWRDRYAELYDQAPAGYLSLSEAGSITRANHAAAELLRRRRDDLFGRPFEQFVAPQEQAVLRRFLAQLFQSGQRAVLDVVLFEAQASAGPRQVRIEANLDAGARVCRMILTDMGTDDVREAARRRAFQVLDNINEGVLVCDVHQNIVSVNPAFTALTGYPVEEALGRNPRFLGRRDAHPADYYENALRRLRADGRWQGVAYNRRRDGTFYTAHMSLTVMRDDDGAISYYIGVLSDITARERAEQELLAWSRELDERVAARTAELSESREQLRKLAEHLETVKEEERKHIARDIHDELGQNLLALRIDISMLSARTGERHSRLRQRVDAALETVDGTIRSVRGIMNELRPPVLDLGLPAALEWQMAEFRKRSGLGCTLSLPAEASCAAIPPEMAIVLFRSLQEALSNVRRHAQATWVEVELVVEQERLTFSVADNGIGIAAASYCKSGSFGLIGMAQRVEALNGSFDIAQLPAGGGCRLTLGFDL